MSIEHRSEIQMLLCGLHTPLAVDERCWERLLRLGRASGLHARLAENNLGKASMSDVVRRHLLSASRIAAHRQQLVRLELFHLAALCSADFPVIVLKGAAYILQGRDMARGRFVSDVDLLVPRLHLRTMEERLRQAGWEAAPLEPYDERYYRDWSHETPPMRFPGRGLEVDLHHAITPVTGSLAFDPAPLFERCEQIPGTPFYALCPEDQVLHACLHCFQDGELDLRLREVADIQGLLREFATSDDFVARLVERARFLGLERPLWYGLYFANAWHDDGVSVDGLNSLPRPSLLARWLMDRLVPLSMFPPDPDFPPPLSVRFARKAMQVRYHLQRMPLSLLLPHLAHKTISRFRARASKQTDVGPQPL